jgi:hypothetical protein
MADRYKKVYGELPAEEWPEERHRQVYRIARRILDEKGGRAVSQPVRRCMTHLLPASPVARSPNALATGVDTAGGDRPAPQSWTACRN